MLQRFLQDESESTSRVLRTEALNATRHSGNPFFSLGRLNSVLSALFLPSCARWRAYRKPERFGRHTGVRRPP